MSYYGNEYERRTLMNIEALYFQKYFYFKHLNQSSSEHRVTYWVKLSRDIELHRLMYALLDVVQCAVLKASQAAGTVLPRRVTTILLRWLNQGPSSADRHTEGITTSRI